MKTAFFVILIILVVALGISFALTLREMAQLRAADAEKTIKTSDEPDTPTCGADNCNNPLGCFGGCGAKAGPCGCNGDECTCEETWCTGSCKDPYKDTWPCGDGPLEQCQCVTGGCDTCAFICPAKTIGDCGGTPCNK